jgi:hypothetical protein
MNGHKPLIISTGISLFAIVTMAFYLGAKTETVQTVSDNQTIVVLKLDGLIKNSANRDIEVARIEEQLKSMHEAVTDIQVSLREKRK